MTELTHEQSEAILNAAADGRVSDGAGATGELLVSLHSPGETTRVAPALTESGRTLTGRIARRTAIAASVAVLGLAGVAAAATGTATLLDSDEPEVVEVVDEGIGVDEEDVVEEVVEDEGPDDEASVGEDEPGDADETELDGESATDTPQGGHPAIDGVDPTDGLDDEELELACAGAENHGHYVSLVARDRTTETEGTHGERVSEAARSDCGKQDAEGEDSESVVDDGDDSDSDTDTDEIDADEDARGNSHGNSHGNGNGASNGNGHAKAKGKGHDKD